MKRIKAKLYINDIQEDFLWKSVNAYRFVYNYFLARAIKQYEKYGKPFDRFEADKHLTWLKKQTKARIEYQRYGALKKDGTRRKLKPEIRIVDCTWLQEVSKWIGQDAIKNLDLAFKNFYRRLKNGETPGFPKFKCKGKARNSFSIFGESEMSNVLENKVSIPKIKGEATFRCSKKDMKYISRNSPSSYTIYEDAGAWYISFVVKNNCKKLPKTNKEVGIDVGTVRLYTRDDGKFRRNFESQKNVRYYKRRMLCLQKELSKKVKGSKNFLKTKGKLKVVHKKIRNSRLDYTNKASKHLVEKYDVIVIEDLSLKKMTKSSAGTKESPGTNVKHKSKLNRNMLDNGIGMFVNQLAYKADWYGKQLIKVNPAYTSQCCSSCGHIDKANRETQSKFICQACGLTMNADKNAAKNILAKHKGQELPTTRRPSVSGRRGVKPKGFSHG